MGAVQAAVGGVGGNPGKWEQRGGQGQTGEGFSAVARIQILSSGQWEAIGEAESKEQRDPCFKFPSGCFVANLMKREGAVLKGSRETRSRMNEAHSWRTELILFTCVPCA